MLNSVKSQDIAIENVSRLWPVYGVPEVNLASTDPSFGRSVQEAISPILDLVLPVEGRNITDIGIVAVSEVNQYATSLNLSFLVFLGFLILWTSLASKEIKIVTALVFIGTLITQSYHDGNLALELRYLGICLTIMVTSALHLICEGNNLEMRKRI